MSERRLPRPNRRLLRAVEAAVPAGSGHEVRIDDFGVYIGRMVGPGHWRGRRVDSAAEVPGALASLAADRGAGP